MSQSTENAPRDGVIANLLYRPPWVGLLAFFIVFIVQAAGHTVMIVMEEVWPGEHYVYQSAFAMGLVGFAMLFYGMRSEKEIRYLDGILGRYISLDGLG